MNYEVFKMAVGEIFMDYMPEDYQGYKLEIQETTKTNQTLDMIKIITEPKEKGLISPVLYVNNMFEQYRECGDMEKVLSESAEKMQEAFQSSKNFKLDFDNAKEQIAMRLINTEQNEKMLESIPHREMEDLSIIYYYTAESVELGAYNITITNDLAKYISLDEQALYELASKNTPKLFPAVVMGMSETMRECLSGEEMPEEMREMLMEEIPANDVMFVVGNEQKMYGAVSMLYENELQKLAETLGNDLYILPSSVHEVIAVRAEGNPEELAEIVNEVNMSQVSLEERLSNQVYKYDRESRTLSVAVDCPCKRLDGADMEREERRGR